MGERTASLTEKELGYSEALASWIVRYLDPSGYECQLLLEAETGTEVLAKGESAIARLTELKCVPVHSGNHNGNGQGEASQPAPKTIQKVDSQAAKKMCPIHNIEMVLWERNGKCWYSHRWNDRWCKGGAK